MCGDPDLNALALMASRFIYFGAMAIGAMVAYRFMMNHKAGQEETVGTEERWETKSDR